MQYYGLKMKDMSITPNPRPFCWDCHRPTAACFCAMAVPFESPTEFAIIVHPDEAASTVGTAWILRRSMKNLFWIRSSGWDLDTDLNFLARIHRPDTIPFLMYPSPKSLNIDLCTKEEWVAKVPVGLRPLFIVVDGTWTQASAILRRSPLLMSLPRVTFQDGTPSEYGFKIQPHPSCLSCVEGVHRVIDKMSARGWASLPPNREHDRMLDIFRHMVRFQLDQERNPRIDQRLVRRRRVKEME